MDTMALPVQVHAERRFGGVARLYGQEGAARIAAASACVSAAFWAGRWPR